MGREIELKLEIDGDAGAGLRSLGMIEGTPRSERLVSTYFDTPKGKLRQKGWVLRLRRHGDSWTQTVKRSAAGAGLFDRQEWESKVTGPGPDLQAINGCPVRKTIGPHQFRNLVPLFRSDVERTSWDLRSHHALIEVSYDVGEITAGNRTTAVRELELELKDGDSAELLAVAATIARRVPVRLAVQSKSERGYSLVKESGTLPRKAAPVELEPDCNVRDGFAAIVIACLKHFRLNEPVFVQRLDIEALHQVRVAVRRLRTALWLFKPATKGLDHARFNNALKLLTRELGAARNIDVILSTLAVDDPVRGLLEKNRRQLYAAIVRKLATKKFRSLVFDIMIWSHAGEWRNQPRAGRRLLPFAVKRLDQLWNRIEGSGSGLKRLSDEERHRVRINTKKIRYGLDFLSVPLNGQAREHRAFGKAAEALQDSLGQLNDLTTRREVLGRVQEPPAGFAASCLRDARNIVRKMKKVGPYWREVVS